MSISQYVIGGSAIAVALAVGYAKWTGKSAEVATGRAEVAIVKAECTTNTAEEINRSALGQIARLTSEVNKQRETIAALDKKSNDRLRENNELRRKISNAKDNPPVPDAIESVLEFDRLRSSVPGATGADSANEGGSGDDAGAARRDMPGASGAPAETR